MGCTKGDNYQECPHWNNLLKTKSPKKEVSTKDRDGFGVSWTGNSLGRIDLSLITQRSTPIVIGVVGPENAGKTTLLTMIYLLLASGKKIGDWNFTGSYTMLGWENLAYFPRWKPGNNYQFPPRTPRNSGRNQGFLHLALRKNNITKDIIFIDAPGERFTKWAININDERSADAKWIHKNSDAFMFFIDCDIFTTNKRGSARSTLNSIAMRLADGLDGRPLSILWAKADKKEAVRDTILQRINNLLRDRFGNSYSEFEVSKEPKYPKMQKNVLEMVNTIIEEYCNENRTSIIIPPISDDYFLSYRKQ